jgi:hypothetical protein
LIYDRACRPPPLIIRAVIMNPFLPSTMWCALVALAAVSGRAAAANKELTEHWAFRPAQRPAVPKVHGADRLRTPIDAFVLAQLEPVKLALAPDADRITLLRRAYFDLWGLPPTPEDVDAFLKDDRPDAFERVLDKLLSSSRFGERWARHWLDVAGYADTVGFDIDATLIIQAEGKWRYRDYVINAFNKDMPYDQFVREQLAGDEMTDWRQARAYTLDIRN